MSKIDLSAGWVTEMIPRMFRLTGGLADSINTNTSGLLNSGRNNTIFENNNTAGVIFLMKGAVPASLAEIDTLITRQADILCSFYSGSNLPGDFSPSQVNVNPSVISTEYTNASASGISTWFWWVTGFMQANTVSLSPTTPFLHNAYGTVGLLGSASDLELPNTFIVLGEAYRIRNLKLQFPTILEY